MPSILLIVFWIVTVFSLPPPNAEQRREVNELDEFFRGKRNARAAQNKNIPFDKNKDIITSSNPPEYTMNLDESVEERWGALCIEHNTSYTQIYEYIDYVMKAKVPDYVDNIYAIALEWFESEVVSQSYRSEIEFFAECTSIPLKGVVIVNLMEVFMVLGCTSVVGADDKSPGTIFHGRNQDLGLDAIQPALRAIVMNVEYTSGGAVLFKGSTFFGFSGLHVGVKQGAFSISLNSRYTNTLGQNIDALVNGWYPATWLIRDTLSQYQTYAEALGELVSRPIIIACYFTIGGVEYPDGAVVTRNHTQSINLWSLGDQYQGWFVAVANTDWWRNDVTSARRDVVIENMNTLTQSRLNANTMKTVMRQVPTINFGTLTSSVLSASRPVANMHRTQAVQLTVLEEEEEAQEPILIEKPGLDDSNNIDTKWTAMVSAVFIMLCILAMCGTYVCLISSKKQYGKVLEEML
eukprot:270202_1